MNHVFALIFVIPSLALVPAVFFGMTSDQGFPRTVLYLASPNTLLFPLATLALQFLAFHGRHAGSGVTKSFAITMYLTFWSVAAYSLFIGPIVSSITIGHFSTIPRVQSWVAGTPLGFGAILFVTAMNNWCAVAA